MRNDGDGAAAATTLRFYLSTDATITTSDTSGWHGRGGDARACGESSRVLSS